MSCVVVTGASQGIGAAIAAAFAESTDLPIALVARTQSNLDRVADQTRGVTFSCDVTRGDAVSAMAQEVITRFGAPAVLVNNAGRFVPGSIMDTDTSAFMDQLEVNLVSGYMVTRAFLPAMLEQGAGHLFFMGSVASIKAYPGAAAYCAAKHGLLGLARCLRQETKSAGLRVTTLMPGATLTPSWDGSQLPPSRLMDAADIAQTVVDIWRLSHRTVVEGIVLRPQEGDI
ncbi:MAG: SDR family NAD(P)-dependent oxidoreductase [Bacteroidota bacterium]|nr:SDR family NAD(P)-dependent oxidoreductase [Bacteroidota bacterium]